MPFGRSSMAQFRPRPNSMAGFAPGPATMRPPAEEPSQWARLPSFLLNEFPGLLAAKVRGTDFTETFQPSMEAFGRLPAMYEGLNNFARENFSLDALSTPEGSLNAAMMAMTGGLGGIARGGMALGSGMLRRSPPKAIRLALQSSQIPMTKVLRNPTNTARDALYDGSKYKALRMFTDGDTGDVYFWDANDATHHYVAQLLGIERPRFPNDLGLWTKD